jgi:hypothetical protein
VRPRMNRSALPDAMNGPRGTAHCAEVLSSADPSGVTSLRILERVDGFHMQRLDDRREPLDELLFETMDEAMDHVYSHYDEVSDWRPCPDVPAT